MSNSIPTIHAKPDQSRLRASAVAILLAVFALIVSLGWGARGVLELSNGYPFRAATVFSIVALMTLGGLRTHPFRQFGLANTVTAVRAALVSLVLAAAAEPAARDLGLSAAVAALAAAALDGADGWLARRTGMTSEFGARFDMEVDALLVLALSVLAWRAGKAGPWILSAGMMRYAFVAAGWMWGWLRHPLPPRRRRQTVCVIQVLSMSAALLPVFPPMAASTLLGGALLLLSYSFAVDIAWLWRPRTKLGGAVIA